MDEAESLKSPLLIAAGFRHAFFTRRGGVSRGPFATLSFSVGAGDDADAVAKNLERAARALGVDPGHVYFLSQVHGRVARTLDGTADWTDITQREGDALVSVDPRVACGVRSADCVPVLVADRASGAVAAAHAGWRGVVAGVVESAVSELRALAGGRGNLVAAIGPHISLEAFEVSEEVASELAGASPDPAVVERQHWPKPHVDLRRLVRAKLAALGLPDRQVDDVAGCTVGSAELFFSFRRDGPRSGRHLSAIVPRLHG